MGVEGVSEQGRQNDEQVRRVAPSETCMSM